GVLLYECLTLHRPFEADTREALHRAILADEPPDPGRFLPGLSQDLRTIVRVALEKDRERRYPTAAALAEDLRRFRAREPILARAASQVYRMKKLVRRHRPLVASLSALVLVLAVATTLVARGMLRERARAEEILRLSALPRLEYLSNEADQLWPAVPDNIE